ncbi:hypothetical protein GCM10028806_42260 [Spirosoma terrae]|uniref:Secretion system C-terminal sorting domain-containing protein n=1 Tax=Spirosoma terrae TaxID=1968276 RepID=A0A6L9L737_9BACT|nr:hypothetical protein [Spirosoma terrae]NDU94108.1 hypothetical protein [Spirosoma terrae]
MLTLLSKLALSALISTSSLTDTTTPKSATFDASAFVTNDNQVRVSVIKPANSYAELVLRDSDNQVVFRQSLRRKEDKLAVKLNVNQLADGKYELEVVSKEGSIRKQLDLSTKPVETSSRLVAMQ